MFVAHKSMGLGAVHLAAKICLASDNACSSVLYTYGHIGMSDLLLNKTISMSLRSSLKGPNCIPMLCAGQRRPIDMLVLKRGTAFWLGFILDFLHKVSFFMCSLGRRPIGKARARTWHRDLRRSWNGKGTT